MRRKANACCHCIEYIIVRVIDDGGFQRDVGLGEPDPHSKARSVCPCDHSQQQHHEHID
jgi:hypothetical protein